jgi:hypothetical protein
MANMRAVSSRPPNPPASPSEEYMTNNFIRERAITALRNRMNFSPTEAEIRATIRELFRGI